jgi:hypothetical protein
MSKYQLGQEVEFTDSDGTEQIGTITKFYATAVDLDVQDSETGAFERHHVMVCQLRPVRAEWRA